LLRSIDAHSKRLNALVWLPGSNKLLSAGNDGKIKLWQSETGQLLRSFEGHKKEVMCLALSPDSKTFASGSKDQTIRLWNVQSSRPGRILNDVSSTLGGSKDSVAWSPDGTTLASGDPNGTLQIWNPESGQLLYSIEAYCGHIPSLAWSPDGQLLVCSGLDGTARVWDVKNNYKLYAVLLPLWGLDEPGIAINPEGDYRGPPGIEEHLVCVVQTDRGQELLSPKEFAFKYGWVNEPWQVGLYKPGAEKVERIYVNAASEGSYDGKSWATAFNDLQDALSIAQPDTEIWVAAGVYTPDRGTGGRTASFHLKNGVRLLGGFSGTETSSYQRDPNNNETILSGDLKGDDGPGFANNEENSCSVVVSNRTDETAVLDGFIVTGGNANMPLELGGPDCGGGLYNNRSGPKLIDCVFRYNSAIDNGGGVFNHNCDERDTRPTLVNCLFSHNSARNGAGVTNESTSSTLINCTFKGNSAEKSGGAMANYESSTILINCRFVGNSAELCGGGMVNDSSPLAKLAKCTFTNNSAKQGGGVCNNNRSNLTFAGGGGMSNGFHSSPTLTNCMFLTNRAEDVGGGMVNFRGCEPTLANCIFIGNLAPSGGGMASYHRYEEQNSDYIRFNKPTLINCTFILNKADIIGGGVFDAEDSGSTLINCILWENSDSSGMDESAQIDNSRTDQILVIKYCSVQGWTGKLGGTGNFGADPLFVDPNGPDNIIGTLDDNLRLGLSSPCLNAGDNSALPADTADLDKDGDVNELIPFDIEGRPRILNGVVDLGAYEGG